MDDLGIEEAWRSWKGGSEGRRAFLERLADLLYRDPGRFGFEDVDAAADALLSRRERILGLLDRYEERGSSFEAYVASSLRFLAKTQRRSRQRAREREAVCEQALRFDAGEAEEWEGEPPASELSEGGRPSGPSSRRHRRARDSRILFLLLKCAWEAGDREARLAASLTGLSESWVAARLTQARRFLEVERCRFERLVARRDRSWSALRLLEARLAEEVPGPRREVLLRSLERARLDHARALAELAEFRPLVPNAVVARLLKVPKGSVDSAIHYVKRAAAACPAAEAHVSLPPWNSSSPPATRTSSSNSAPSSRGTASSVRPNSATPPSRSRKTAQPTSTMPSSRPGPSSP